MKRNTKTGNRPLRIEDYITRLASAAGTRPVPPVEVTDRVMLTLLRRSHRRIDDAALLAWLAAAAALLALPVGLYAVMDLHSMLDPIQEISDSISWLLW